MRRAMHGGFGLAEFLVALLVFSAGILALLQSQLLGARLAHEGLQRSIATALAQDLIARIQLNAGRADLYRIDSPSGLLQTPGAPAVDCAVGECAPAHLASFELWQWLRLLGGESVLSDDDAGGDGDNGSGQNGATGDGQGQPVESAAGVTALANPAVCVDRHGGVLTVAVGWFTREASGVHAGFRCVDGAITAPQGESSPPGLYSLTLSAWVGEAL